MKETIGTIIIIMLGVAWGVGAGLLINQEELEQAKEYIIELENNRYDVNLDGEVTAADYVAIRNYIMNKD